MNKKLFMDYLPEELIAMDIKPQFRIKQLYHWVYRKYLEDFHQMQNIPKTLREFLSENFIVNPFELIRHEIAADETEKFLFNLQDGSTV